VPTGYDLNWTAVVVAAGVGFMAMALMFALSFILSPRRHLARKGIAYECGIEPESYTPVHLNIRYYIFAILFLIFDVEAVFLFPWAVVFLDLKSIPAVFYEMLLFIGILLFGILYGWKKGALQWR
jgi:NADH-quinone oxidoreductase subunit A